jgi:uncharacterized protein
LSNASLPSSGSPPYEVEEVRDVRIPTGEPDCTLSADLYLPAGAGPVPALVMVLPYRKDASVGIEQEPSLRWMAKHGYASVLVDFRGIGSSDGTMRPPLDPSEADDGVAAVEWAARQPWCNGNVGMWGLSYGAIMSMRTAARGPAPLKAIIPIMGWRDPERDFVHPHGSRGAYTPIPHWSTGTLGDQLLPPLHNYHDAEEQRRWQQRLHNTEPWMIDFARHGPEHPVWRDRALDPSQIGVPSLCVAAWWDIFREGQIAAYERIPAPKQLLVGPWMHTMPHDSPFDPIGFLAIARRWWDHWLRGVDNGVPDEPPVSLYVQGSDPGWRAYESWPPADGKLEMATDSDTTLTERKPGASKARHDVIADYQPDPTIGSLSGLWALIGQKFGLPLDQHDDDSRSICATSEPLTRDLVIAGRPEVTVGLANLAVAPVRLVVRLCHVDKEGRSTLIASGVVVGSQRVVLCPTAHRIPAGHRLRIAVSDSDFPRLWPLQDAPSLQIVGIDLVAPTVSERAGTPIEMPSADDSRKDDALGLWEEPRWQITRDPVNDGLDVVMGTAAAAHTAGSAQLLERRHEVRASVRRDAPEATVVGATDTQVARLRTGERIEVTVSTRLTAATLWARGQVDVDGTTVFSRTWNRSLALGDIEAPAPVESAEPNALDGNLGATPLDGHAASGRQQLRTPTPPA